jgi:hypothetical protein
MHYFFVFILLVLAWGVPAAELQAEVVGRFVQVEGEVDLLKQGKMPAVFVKVQDAVTPGDVIRTKTQGKAQVKFVDDSVITIGPGSRVAIETFMYDPAKNKRQGVIQVFRGIVETVVTKILKAEQQEFIMKTNTAIMGVRGTKWYAVLGPTSTDIYNESGSVAVKNIFPEIAGEAILKEMQFTRVFHNLPPTMPTPFTPQDLAPVRRQLSAAAVAGAGAGPGAGTESVGALGTPGSDIGSPTSAFSTLDQPLVTGVSPLDPTKGGNPIGAVTNPIVMPIVKPPAPPAPAPGPIHPPR